MFLFIVIVFGPENLAVDSHKKALRRELWNKYLVEWGLLTMVRKFRDVVKTR
jgi:hypothetical protein